MSIMWVSYIVFLFTITGPYCEEMGINHHVTKEPFSDDLPSCPPTNGVILDLEDAVQNTFQVINILWPDLFADLNAYVSRTL